MGVVVVALDGSETSRAAFEIARREAEWRGASLHAVHVMSYPTSLGYGVGYVDFDTLRASGQAFLDAEIEKLAGAHDPFPVELTHELAIGHTGVELTRIATNEGGEPAELVVIGSRGLGGFRGLLLGSVSTYLVHHLDTPILVIPSTESLREA